MTMRIQRWMNGKVVTFALSGNINWEESAELQRVFESEEQDRHIVRDMGDVKLVDRDPVRFLGRCQANGVLLENCPGYIREWTTVSE